MEIFLVWIIASIIVAIIAGKARNRNGFGWFLLSLLFSPLLMVVLVLALPRKSSDNTQTRKCPACAESVRREATICKHCRSQLTPIPIEPKRDWRIPEHA
jgi:hypothetical protein